MFTTCLIQFVLSQQRERTFKGLIPRRGSRSGRFGRRNEKKAEPTAHDERVIHLGFESVACPTPSSPRAITALSFVQPRTDACRALGQA